MILWNCFPRHDSAELQLTMTLNITNLIKNITTLKIITLPNTVLLLDIQLSKGGGGGVIQLTDLTQPHFCDCPKPKPGYPTSYLFYVLWFEVRGDCWYWWNCWSLFKLSFHKNCILLLLKWWHCTKHCINMCKLFWTWPTNCNKTWLINKLPVVVHHNHRPIIQHSPVFLYNMHLFQYLQNK